MEPKEEKVVQDLKQREASQTKVHEMNLISQKSPKPSKIKTEKVQVAQVVTEEIFVESKGSQNLFALAH